MNPKYLIAAATLVTTGLIAAQGAMAYQAGALFVRDGIDKDEVGDDNGPLDGVGVLEASDERGMAYAITDLFSDRPGIELNGSVAGEHRLTTAALGGPSGGMDRLPVNLRVNYHPMGDSGSWIRPYEGAGLVYTHVSEEALEALDVDAAGEGTPLGKARLDPMPLGGAVIFRF
ncbi:MAG: OmpW family outer membrane protein [Halomonas sp.]|nr:OmpW family outer membrane protein [Halomonas sp.]